MTSDDRPTGPTPLNAHVTAQMKRMPRKDTTPEVALRRALHARGLRFRLHARDLPGKPDIVLARSRVAVFVDGCFWHLCPEHATMPKNNATWWRDKLERNRTRDLENDEALRQLGWLPVHVWEHELPVDAADKLALLCRRRLPGA